MKELYAFGSGTLVGFLIGYTIWRQKFKNSSDDDDVQIFYESDKNSNSKDYRLIMGVRNDLKMQKGKVAAQCAHAAVAAYVKAMKRAPNTLKKWIKYGQAKICVRIENEEEMLELRQLAKEYNILTSIIQDAGHTQVSPGTCTVIAFGPAPKAIMDELTGHLKLY